jgi:gamma-glutamylcyclotransferase (GGCT)/AIG2-like uncharacterized protein YtfP
LRKGRKPGWSTEAQEIVDRLFAYGTLRAGQTARSMIEQHVAGSLPGTCPGTMYAFEDGYPGMLDDGDTAVIGEIVELIDLPAAFALLDAYEGDDFMRILKRARLEDGTEVWTWVYVLADPSLAEQGELIADGDWVAYQKKSRAG